MKLRVNITVKIGNLALAATAISGGLLVLLLTNVQALSPFTKGLPGAGFFPTLCGIAISLCGVGILITTLRRIRANDPALGEMLISESELINFLFVIGLSLFTMIAYRWIGLLVSLFIVVLVVCRFLSHESWLKSILIAAGTFVTFYLCFITGLGVPMPNSLIGI